MSDEKLGAGGAPGIQNKQVPGAPPPQVLTAIDIMLREWTRVEAGKEHTPFNPPILIRRYERGACGCFGVVFASDRMEWTYQRTEMQAKIERLEKAVAEHERTKVQLTRQLQALEFGLRQERAKQKSGGWMGGGGAGGFGSTAIHNDEKSDKLSDLKGGRNLSKKVGPFGSFGKPYQTLPANISRHLSSDVLTPGRGFLKQYLETSGYLPIDKQPKEEAKGSGGGKSSLLMVNPLGRRPSGASSPDSRNAAAASSAAASAGSPPQKPDDLSADGRKKAASISGAIGKPKTSAPTPASSSASTTAPADKKGVAAALAAAKDAAAAKEGTTTSPDSSKDAKTTAAPTPSSAAPSTPSTSTPDEKKGVLGAVIDLCTKFVEQNKATQWKQPLVLKSHMDAVRGMAWHDKDPILLTASEDGTCKFWNLTQALKDKKKKSPKPAEPLFSWIGHRSMLTSVACRSEQKGGGLAFTGGVDGKVISWKFPSMKHDPYSELGKCSAFKKNTYKHKDAVWSVAVHPTEPLLFSASADGLLCAWNFNEDDADASTRFNFAHLESSTGERAIPTAVTTVPNDTHKIVVSYTNGDVCLVDLSTGKAANIIKPAEPLDLNGASSGPKHTCALSCHPTLSLALSANVDQCVRYYDLKSASCVAVMRAHRDIVTSVAIEPILGIQAATSSHDQMIRFWDLGTRKILQNLEPHQTHQKKFDEAVHCVSYHPSLSMVASAGADSVVKVFGMT